MRQKIRTISIFLSLMAVIITFPALSSAEQQKHDKCTSYFEPGSWSVQFQIADQINLEPFNGKAISLKYHLSEKSAIRLGLNLGLGSDDSDSEHSYTYRDTLEDLSELESESSSQMAQLNLVYMLYPNPDGKVKLFYGAGPLVMVSRTKSERESIDTTGDSMKESHWGRSWALGLIGIFGAEWFATDAISFHAEYRAIARYMRTNSEVDRTSYNDSRASIITSDKESDDWDFDASKVTFGISLYF